MAAHIGQYAQCQADDGRVAGTHAIHAVVHVAAVAHRHHYECGDDYKQNPSGGRFVAAHEAHEAGIVEIVVLHKRDGGDGAFHRLALVHYHFGLPSALHGHVLAYHSIGAQPQGKAHHQTQQGLSCQLPDWAQAVLAVFHLDVVVQQAQQAQPQGGANHQNHVHVAQSPKQQAGYHDGHDDDDAAHGGHSLLFHAVWVDAGVALCLIAAMCLHPLDETFSEPHGYEQAQYQCEQRTERDVLPHAASGDTKLFQVSKQII